jgi:hypothetical protein
VGDHNESVKGALKSEIAATYNQSTHPGGAASGERNYNSGITPSGAKLVIFCCFSHNHRSRLVHILAAFLLEMEVPPLGVYRSRCRRMKPMSSR